MGVLLSVKRGSTFSQAFQLRLNGEIFPLTNSSARKYMLKEDVSQPDSAAALVFVEGATSGAVMEVIDEALGQFRLSAPADLMRLPAPVYWGAFQFSSTATGTIEAPSDVVGDRWDVVGDIIQAT